MDTDGKIIFLNRIYYIGSGTIDYTEFIAASV